MFEIFPKLWTIVYEAKPIEQLGVALSLLPILLSWVLWLRARVGTRSAYEQLANANDRIKILEQNRDEAIAARKVAEAERDALSPDHWLRLAEKEREQGNEEEAMDVLAHGFAGVRAGMAHTALALAGHHLSQILGPDRTMHLDEGERFARIATLLDPNDADAATLTEEAAMERIDDCEDVDIPELTAALLPSNSEGAETLIYALCAESKQKLHKGHYHHCYLFARRAELISRRAGLYDAAPGCSARFRLANALEKKGRYAEAIQIISALQPIHERLKGAEHEDVLASRIFECSLLYNIGDFKAALKKLHNLRPVCENVFGVEHHSVLVMRYQEVECLNKLGDHRTALENVRALYPIFKKVQGPEHFDVLNTLGLECNIINNTGDHIAALKIIKDLIIIEERIKGSEHPHVLGSRHLEIEILSSLGHHSIALEKVQILLPIRERVLGVEHPHVLKTQALMAVIMANIEQKNWPVAPTEVESLG